MELENILLQHPAVLDAGVIGRPAPNENAVPMAFIVKKPGVEVSENEIMEYVASQVKHRLHFRLHHKMIIFKYDQIISLPVYSILNHRQKSETNLRKKIIIIRVILYLLVLERKGI